MPLDLQAKQLIDQLTAMGGPQLHEMPVEGARQMMRAMAGLSSAGAPAVSRVEELHIPGPAGEIPARLYAPASSPPLPALVFFHGGGWVIGDLETHDLTCRKLALGSDCAVISIDYRLAPEHKFPAAPEDCYAALQWVAEHGKSLGIDPSRIAVGGDSAGGNLTAVVAQMARDRRGHAPIFQLLIYPATDAARDTASYHDNADGYLLSADAMKWFYGHYLAEASSPADPLHSPLHAKSLKGLPPALVITAEFDPLRDEGEAYGEALRRAGVPVAMTRYAGMIHGFFGMGTLMEQANTAMYQACDALRAAFRG